MPVFVEPTLTELHTRSVFASASGMDQILIASGHCLGYQRGISADEIDAHFLGRPIQSLCNRHIILRRFAGRLAHKSDGSHGNSLIYNGDSVIPFNSLAGLHQIPCHCRNLIVYLLIQAVQIRIDAVHQADSQRNGPHIQIILLYHLIRFSYFI